MVDLELRPGHPSITCTTPLSAEAVALFGGGGGMDGVVFTRSEMEYLIKLYGYTITAEPETYPEVAPDPGPEPGTDWKLPAKQRQAQRQEWQDAQRKHLDTQPQSVRDRHRIAMAGASRNCLRHAQIDGLRAIGMLARFCEPGQDPLKVLAGLMQDAGFDLQTGWEEDE